jgi:hypothetical protein
MRRGDLGFPAAGRGGAAADSPSVYVVHGFASVGLLCVLESRHLAIIFS